MRNTLTNDIDRAKYDTLVTKGGYKMANDWVRFSVMMYDLFRAQRADRGVADEDMPNGSQFMLRATMEVISEVLDLHISAQRRIMNDLEKQQVSFIFQQRNPQVFYGLRIAEQNLTPKGATSYEIPSDAKRLYEAAFVTIRVPDPDGGPARDWRSTDALWRLRSTLARTFGSTRATRTTCRPARSRLETAALPAIASEGSGSFRCRPIGVRSTPTKKRLPSCRRKTRTTGCSVMPGKRPPLFADYLHFVKDGRFYRLSFHTRAGVQAIRSHLHW
jgi:hypothetical protein